MKKSDARILVVDDDSHLLNLLTETLSSLGYSAEDAGSAREALDKLSRSNFHLIVSDIKMPEMDGLSLLSSVRKNYPGLPVIFITGIPNQQVTGSANPEGILTKPFRISNLEYLIEQALEEKLPEDSRDDSGELPSESLKTAD